MKPVKRHYIAVLAAALLAAAVFAGCARNTPPADSSPAAAEEQTAQAPEAGPVSEAGTSGTEKPESREEPPVEKTLKLFIDGREMPVTWQDNASVEELKGLAVNGLNVRMSMYGGFEQVGPLGKSISRNDAQTVTASGDIVLYSGNQIVIFYGSNSWSYTRLGHIGLPEEEMTDLLSNGDVTVRIIYG